MKGVGRIYQQTYMDTYSRHAICKLYDRKIALVAADLLDDRVLPFYEAEGIPILRIMTDRGTEYCGNVERHEYQLYLALNDIEHTRTKTKSPQTNEICERFHKTVIDEFYRVAFRKKIYTTLQEYREISTHGSMNTTTTGPPRKTMRRVGAVCYTDRWQGHRGGETDRRLI